MKKIDLKNVCKSALPLILICLLISSLLAFVNFLTEGAIEKEKNLESENARKNVLSSASYFEKSKIDSIEYYKGFNGENLTGYVFLTTAKGYGGKIEVITGISCDGTISGISILSQDETPGLGANIKNDGFKDQFKKKISANGFNIVKNSTNEDNEIQAITGATISSKAVTSCVNEAIEIFRKINRKW